MSDERAALVAAAAALGLSLESRACDRLLRYLALLRKWNRVYNLTSIRDAQHMLIRHLYDSLAVVQPLARELSRRSKTWDRGAQVLDVGSGPGLPGVVFAICCPDVQVSCIDAVAKKAAFVQQVALELSLVNLRSIHSRVETFHPEQPVHGFDLISARAFASLEKLVSCTSHLMAAQGSWLAMKGKAPADEIGALPSFVQVFHVEPVAVPELAAQRCIIWMRKKAS